MIQKWMWILGLSLCPWGMAAHAKDDLAKTSRSGPGAGPVTLRCEYRESPLGIDSVRPRLSWTVEIKNQMPPGPAKLEERRRDIRGIKQSAYQILVASGKNLLTEDKADLWNSGRVENNQSIHVEYDGKPLESRMRCFWKVRVWTTTENQPLAPSPWSAAASWTMGLLDETAWSAKWISTEVSDPDPIAKGSLKILKATYMARDGSGSADVTELVASKVKNDTLSLMVGPDALGGDPARMRVKDLKVDYEVDGKPGSMAAVDFRTLSLPPRDSLAPLPLDAPYVRKAFNLDEIPESAVATVNVLGFYELHVNGNKVGDDVLSPALTNYHKRSFYVTYDLRPHLRKGRNVIGLWTSRGWYWKVLDGRANPAVQHDTAIARLQLDMIVNGKPMRVATGDDWRCKASGRSILGTWSWNQMGGESVDARLEDPNWADPKTDDASWYPVVVVPAPKIPAEAQPCPPTRVIETLPATAHAALDGGRHELDFGRNLTGWLSLRLRGLTAGDEIVIRYFDKKPFTPMQMYNHEDRFISAGQPEEEFRSKFNYHGFRWATIEGLRTAPRLEDAKALVLAANWKTAGSFECSNELFNRMHKVNLWTLLMLSQSGFIADCPHRERLGYGDGQVSIESCVMNFHMAPFYSKWATDWCDGADPETGYLPHTAPQYKSGGGGPAWGGAAQALTWRNRLYYGDQRITQRNYAACLKHVEAMETHAKEDIIRAFGGEWDFIGDWVPPDRGMDSGNWPPKPAAELFNNCYRLYLREQLAAMADLLGRTDEARTIRAELTRLRPIIHAAFYDQENQRYVLDEQSYYLMPLMTGVVPEALRPRLLEKLEECIRVKRKGHLDTGMLGTYFLIQYLQEIGRNDLLFEIVNQKTYPGWGFMLESGATTWWEQWNGHWSQIHSCFTSLDGWFYQGLAGIRPDPSEQAFGKIIIKPAVVGDLTWVKCHHDSMHGRIVSNWKRDGLTLTMQVAIPPNTTATVHVPSAKKADITESGKSTGKNKGLKFLRMENNAAVFEVGSGIYEFRSTLEK